MTYKKERGMGMELKIPENFFVGAAMSGPQTEGAYKTGGRLESIWDTWSDLSISDFYNKVGSYVGNNFYEKYEDDIKLLKSLHMVSVLPCSGADFLQKMESSIRKEHSFTIRYVNVRKKIRSNFL